MVYSQESHKGKITADIISNIVFAIILFSIIAISIWLIRLLVPINLMENEQFGIVHEIIKLSPSMQTLLHSRVQFTPYWQFLFSIMWLLTPLYFLLGVFSILFSIKRGRLNCLGHSTFKILVNFVVGILVLLFFWCVPFVTGRLTINQMSSSYVWLCWAWFVTAFGPFGLGQVGAILIAKIKRRCAHRKHGKPPKAL